MCARCEEQPRNGDHAYCKDCHAEYMREWRKKRKTRIRCPHCGEMIETDDRSDHVVAKGA
jgi:DNA-directed RNA polymerase subunit RPC12/RpoP